MPFEINETEIDGVPALWFDGAGPLTAILSFRVGAVDEPAPRRGITHLVEHLALASIGLPDYDTNGTVDSVRTLFMASGNPADVIGFLREATRALSNLATDRLLLERAVIQREAAEQATSVAAALRGYRFGTAGHGLVAEDEHGARWLGPDLVGEWAREWFVRENAVLVVNREPPAGVAITLPSGRRRSPPSGTEPSWLTLPTAITWQPHAVGLTFTMPRSVAASMAVSILNRRARARLRFESGSVYDVAGDYDALDPSTAHALLGTETDERNVESVTTQLLAVFDQLAADGPTQDELAAEVAGLERQYEHPDGRLAFVDSQALAILTDSRRMTPNELLHDRRSTSAGDVATALRSGGDRLLLASSGPNPAPDRLADYPMWSKDVVPGETFTPTGFHLPGRWQDKLIVGPEGVSLQSSPDTVVTIRFGDVAAVVHENDLRLLISTDGYRIGIAAHEWRKGARIFAAIDDAVPAGLVACGEHGPGGVEAEPTHHEGSPLAR